MGMSGLAYTAALEYSKYGITCNTLRCGVIGTENVATIMPEEIKREYVTKRAPAGKIGDVEDVANAVVFLASEQAKYITGTDLYVDGGAHLNTFSLMSRHMTFAE